MPIKEIKQFSAWLQEGDGSLQQRYEMFLDRKREVEKQIADLQNVLEVINFKCWYYETAIAAGTEKIHTQNQPFPDDLCLDKWHKNQKTPCEMTSFVLSLCDNNLWLYTKGC